MFTHASLHKHNSAIRNDASLSQKLGASTVPTAYRVSYLNLHSYNHNDLICHCTNPSNCKIVLSPSAPLHELLSILTPCWQRIYNSSCLASAVSCTFCAPSLPIFNPALAVSLVAPEAASYPSAALFVVASYASWVVSFAL